MKKNKSFMMGTLAVMLAFGLVLAGCDNGTGSDDNGPSGPTIKLTDTGNNTFTLTLTGAIWDPSYETPNLTPGRYNHGCFEWDGEPTGNVTAGRIALSSNRTSDTVMTVTMSVSSTVYNPVNGSGKLKLAANDDGST
jgi:hypothetical protein